MKPAPFRYHRVSELSEATSLIASLENSRVLAGGQSLIPMMNMRYVIANHLIDLNPISCLSNIRFNSNRFVIGAMTRQRELLFSTELLQYAPIFSEALQLVGHVQTRNRGTIGGSLSHLDPAAELPGLLALYEGTLKLSKHRSSRIVSMKEFVLGYMTPCTEPNEILTEVSFDVWPKGHGYDFREFSQRHGDFAIVGVGTLMTLDVNKCINRIACVLIGIDYQPIRLREIEDELMGQTPSNEIFGKAGEQARTLNMMEDALIPESYRKQLAAVLLKRSLLSSANRAGGLTDD